MTVYIVTDGTYSEYGIEKCFSNRPAAEEYKKWHNIKNEIEEYEIYDSVIDEPYEQRYYTVTLRVNVLTDNHVIFDEPLIETRMLCSAQKHTGISIQKSPLKYSIRMVRSFEADKFNEILHIDKMKKTAYDIVAQVNWMMSEGATISEIDMKLINAIE